MSSRLFKMLPISYSFINHIYLICMCKEGLVQNNQQGLICHKTQPTNPITLCKQIAIILYNRNDYLKPYNY